MAKIFYGFLYGLLISDAAITTDKTFRQVIRKTVLGCYAFGGRSLFQVSFTVLSKFLYTLICVKK